MSEPRAVDRSQHRLLIVNDDPVGRYTTVRLLNAAGFPTLEAGSGAEALSLAEHDVAAVVLDIHLPDINGFELCRLLRSRPATARVPVIHLTAAYVTDEDKVRGLDAGADAYLTHPVEPAVLVSTIQALVRTRAAEDAMRRSESKFRAIYAQAPSGICLLDCAAGTVLDANPAMLALLGRPVREVVGQPLQRYVAPGSEAGAQAFFDAIKGDGARAEFALLTPAGEAVPVEWSASPHIEPGVCMAMATDVSQRHLLARQRQELLDRERSARAEAERLSRMKDDLIAVLSHELRTPLNAIMGWTHVLQRQSPPDLLAKGLAAIDRNVTIQARMIADILDMSRLNIGKLPLSRELVTAGSVIRQAVSAIQNNIEAGGHHLVLDLRGEDLVLSADSGRLQQVLWNLVGNAAKFSPKGSAITLSLAPRDGGVAVQVQDRGQGIAAEFLPHVFDRFTQSDAASNRQHGGLGLGLAIVKSLVEAHGGWVHAHSDGVGQGTTIEFWLPRAQADAPAPETDTSPGVTPSLFGELGEPPAAALQDLRVLLVDDDIDAASMLRMILGERGAVVSAVHTVDEGLRALASERYDLVISDIGMPGRDGYELIRELRELETPGKRLPAIALTAFSRDVDRQQALSAGFDAHLAKPLKPQLLVRLIEQLLTPDA